MNTTISLGSLFLEGLFSFFSPCVLPLIPLYIGYLTQDARQQDAAGNVTYSRRKTALMTIWFTLGVSMVFVLAALGSSALRSFFTDHTLAFQIAGGVLLLLFGLMALNVIRIPWLQQEHQFAYQSKGKMSGWQAFLLGFFFSFAWTPCIGPLLSSAIVMAATASTRLLGYGYIAAYAAGFLVMFLLIGLFTEEMLNFLHRRRKVVQYTQTIGGILILVMGIYMLYQAGTSIAGLQKAGSSIAASTPTAEVTAAASAEASTASTAQTDTDMETYDFELADGSGNMVKLSSFKGQVVVLNFFGTWCPYCKKELPHLQELNDNRTDVKVLLIATPNDGQEGDIAHVKAFMQENNYTMEVLYDLSYSVTKTYGVSGYPTTYLFKKDGNILGYSPGYIEPAQLDQYIDKAGQ